MRQGNGTDLLGASDPRAASIGIIYVAPADDRTSVLAAILTQEKLGRKQVAVVLPNPNKAFQRPVDFDDLKAVRRKLQVNVIFIATPGPGPAEFARQRRFPVYSSLENYAEALREQDGGLLPADAGNNEKKGFWPFSRQKNSVSAPGIVDLPGDEEDEELYDEEPPAQQNLGGMPPLRRSHAQPDDAELLDRPDDEHVGPALAAGAIGGAAAGFALADLENNPRRSVPPPQSMQAQGGQIPGGATQAIHLDDDEEALPPIAPAASAIPIRTGTSVPGPAPMSNSNQAGPAQPVSPDDEIFEESPASGTGVAAGLAAGAAAGPGIIDLSQRKGPRTTAQLPPRPVDQQAAPPRTPRRSGAIAGGAIAAGALGAAALAGSASAPPPSAPVMRTPPPPRAVPGGYRNAPNRSRRSSVLLGLLLLLLTALLVCSALAYLDHPLLSGFLGSSVKLPGVADPVTVSIMPASQVVSNSYVITGVSGTPDPKQQTIKARSLSGTAQSQNLTAKASGHNQTIGSAATGTLTFFNLNTNALTIGAHTVFTASNGVRVWNNVSVRIPAGNPPAVGSQDAAATVLSVGVSGNIGPSSINQSCCVGGVAVKNVNAFSGGVDPANYNFVTQDDINAVATQTVQDQVAQQANTQLKSKLASGEQLAASPQCQAGTSSSAPIGDHHQNVESSDVTISVTCNSVAYDDQGMRTLVTQLLTQKAQISPGTGYILQNNRVIIDPKVQSVNPVSLNVTAKGQWVYQLGDQQKNELFALAKGKTLSAATTALLGAKGVANATIQFSGTTLPTDISQYNFAFENPPPLPPAGGTGGGAGVSPTVTSNAGPGTPISGVGRG